MKKQFYFCAFQECLTKHPYNEIWKAIPTSIKIFQDEGYVTEEDLKLLLGRKIPVTINTRLLCESGVQVKAKELDNVLTIDRQKKHQIHLLF